MGARSGGGGAGFGSRSSLPDKDMGVSVKGNPLQTLLYNSKLQAKSAKGLVFQVGPKKWWHAGANSYGLHIEGKGWVKFKGDKTPYMPNRKSIVSQIQKSGLLSYDNIEFVNPIK